MCQIVLDSFLLAVRGFVGVCLNVVKSFYEFVFVIFHLSVIVNYSQSAYNKGIMLHPAAFNTLHTVK